MNIVIVQRNKSSVTITQRKMQLVTCDGHSVTNCIEVMNKELDSIFKFDFVYGIIISKHDCKVWAHSLDCGVDCNDVAVLIKKMLIEHYCIEAIKFNPFTLTKCEHKTFLIRSKSNENMVA